MAKLTPRFSASRAVCEYTEKHYIPAAAAYLERAANQGELGAQVARWRQCLEEHWAQLRFGGLRVEAKAEVNAFEVEVIAGELDLNSVRVELYADGVNGGEPPLFEMKRLGPLAGDGGGAVYGLDVAAARPATDYTVRAIPYFPGAAVPLEARQILWQR
jgi:starch phosphorylase